MLHIVEAWKRLDRTCKDRYIATCAPAGKKKAAAAAAAAAFLLGNCVHMFSRSNKGLLALPGELQIAFFLAATLTSSMKLWFVLKVFSACFFL